MRRILLAGRRTYSCTDPRNQSIMTSICLAEINRPISIALLCSAVLVSSIAMAQAGAPAITSVTPNTGQQGQTIGVSVVGTSTQFVKDKTKADFGQGITVNSTTVVDSTHTSVNITISSGAALDAHLVTMTTDAEVATVAKGFTVLKGPPPLPDDNAAVEAMNNQYIRLDRAIMSPKDVSDTFGRRIAQRYIAMQISVANRNKDYQWLIQNAGFDLRTFATYVAGRPGCDANLQLLVQALNGDLPVDLHKPPHTPSRPR